jgi:hypothetical protein
MTFEKTIGLADIYGTRAEVAVLDEDEDDPTIHLSLVCGGSATRAMPTLEAARQLAAALLDGADLIERERR